MKYPNAILGTCFALFLPVLYVVLQSTYFVLTIRPEQWQKANDMLCMVGGKLHGM